mgnify:CR=1 FL=1
MNTKSFLASGIVAGIVNYLLGWVFYVQLFPNIYPQDESTNMLFILFGCITFGLFLAYILTVLTSTVSSSSGFKIGAIIGLFYGLSMNLFMYASMEANYQHIAIDILINMAQAAIMGSVIAMLHSKLKS